MQYVREKVRQGAPARLRDSRRPYNWKTMTKPMLLGGWVERQETPPWLVHLSTPQRKRARRLERGLCISCNTPHEQGRTTCRRCADRLAVTQRKRYAVKDAEHRAKYGMSEYKLRAMGRWHPVRLARAVIG